jgi:hypothetical protein
MREYDWVEERVGPVGKHPASHTPKRNCLCGGRENGEKMIHFSINVLHDIEQDERQREADGSRGRGIDREGRGERSKREGVLLLVRYRKREIVRLHLHRHPNGKADEVLGPCCRCPKVPVWV